MNQFGIFKYYEDKKVQAIELGFVKDFMTAIIYYHLKGRILINILILYLLQMKNLLKLLKD